MDTAIAALSGFFAREKTMRLSFCLTVALFGLNLLPKVFLSLYALMIIDMVFLLCVIFLYRAFRRHDKNVQKGLIGAVLMWYTYDEVSYVLNSIVFNADVFTSYDNVPGRSYIFFSLLTCVLFGGLFLNHFIINSDHHSRPSNVYINQVLVLAIAGISLVSIPCQLFVLSGDGWSMAECITWHTGLAALVILIASYESRLDAYRIRREDAGWTEETGYPEGYDRTGNYGK